MAVSEVEQNMDVKAYLQRVATATFENNVHDAFVKYAAAMLNESRSRDLFLRMAERSGIEARYSPLSVDGDTREGALDAYQFYQTEQFPSTRERMELYKKFAPQLM